MGNWICKRDKNLKILMQGLSGAGKTSILYRFKRNEFIKTYPNLVSTEEVIDVGDITIACWDVGGRDKMRPLFDHHYSKTDGFVFIIDSAWRERLNDALEELIKYVLLEEESKNKVVMVLANKQDKLGALTPSQIEQALVEKYKFSPNASGNHTVFVRPCSAVTAEGLDEAFLEFTEQIALKKSGRAKCGLLPLAEIKKFTISEDEGKEKAAIIHEGIKTVLRDPVTFVKSWLY